MTPRRPPNLREVTGFRWHPPAEYTAEEFGISKQDVERIAREPQSVCLDPSTTPEKLTERRTVGDVTAVVRYDDDDLPILLGVYLRLPMQQGKQETGAGLGGPATTAPTTLRGLRAAIVKAGGRLIPGGHHDKVEYGGRIICTIPSSPSDHRAIPNAVAQLRRSGVPI